MMSIEEKAMGYVLGSLSPDERQQVAVERRYHAALDQLIRSAERDLVGLETTTAPPSAPVDLWDRIGSALSQEKAGLAGKYVEDFGSGDWQPHSDKIDVKPLWSEDVILIRCNPGGFEDAHDQPIDKDEHILIMAGDLSIGGRVFGVGDYIRVPAGTEHSRMSSNGGCILFTEYRDPEQP
jgi:anti-sigma factor ChrR (cupin superfamily)